ncbi:MAG: sulfotransferase family 2 domain-containing protein [Actinomycetes bacterium]
MADVPAAAGGSTDPGPRSPWAQENGPYDRHMERGTVVLREHKVLYVPVPKSGWTSMLWLLAPRAGLTPEQFATSAKPEVTLSMAVHDMTVWLRAGLLLESLDASAREQVLTDDGWFRFAVVRDPATRLWSAWQSKLLMREPYYLRVFGDQPWFPRVPETAEDVLEDFRAFTVALAAHAWADDVTDKHWAPQHMLVERLPLNHVGRVESLQDTVDALHAHLGDDAASMRDLPRDNRALLPYSPAIYDEATAGTVRGLFERDYKQYGYDEVVAGDDADTLAAWRSEVADRLSTVREVIARHERLAAFHTVSQKQRASLNKTLDRQTQKLDRKSQQLDRKSQQLDRQRKQTEQLEQRLHKRLHAERQRVAGLESDLQRVTAQRNRLRRRLDALRSSTSWRATRPLRSLGRLRRRR